MKYEKKGFVKMKNSNLITYGLITVIIICAIFLLILMLVTF